MEHEEKEDIDSETDEETGDDAESTEDEETDEEEEDDGKDWKKIAEDQRKRAEKAESKLKGGKSKEKETPKNENGAITLADLQRIELQTLGFKTEGERKIVQNAAKVLGVSLEEAAQEEIVLKKVERLREENQTAKATPRSKKKSDTTTDNIERLAKKAIEDGEYPKDKETREKVRRYLRDNT